jgi:NAD(P)-dependent dehydrogenase (short-subunit alcohol dehydrogenase family)
MEFEGKVAFVSGGGNGIGRAAALLLAQRGAKVCVADYDAAAAAATAQAIIAAGGTAVSIGGDVADKAAAVAMVDFAVESFGALDCALNNAGITHPHDHEWDDDAFQRTIDVNLTGMFHCIKAELVHMEKAGRGAIVNTASIAAIIASVVPNLPGYAASKHAVMGLTKVAALRCASKGIRVNAVLPGVTMTNMVRGVMELGEEARHSLENFAPIGRMAAPEEIAEAALFLASDRASFITGHGLVADGGVTIQ